MFIRPIPRAWHPLIAVYLPGALTLGIDLWVPLDIDTAVLYSVGIVMCGWLRSRRHLWFATALFVAFAYADLLIGNGTVLPDQPDWVIRVNRSFLACTLLLLAGLVHLWIRSVEKIEEYGATLETRVQERTRDLELVSQQRQDAQAALHQAQKMEAVGQLTGGVAHDFNNLLTVIGGNADMLRQDAPGARQERRLDAILQAVDRAARLTRQLLAFSRRQSLRPEALDLREQTSGIIEMMARSLRENVRVAVTIANDLWPVEADPAELELAMLNIGVNARDAMPDGGTISIEARNITFAKGEDRRNGLVGDFVALTISDTGKGMEQWVLDRAFEPYFTTKEVGKGSGLGLSQVYGFASQSGGAVSIRSEVDQGTAVTLYLPRSTRPAELPLARPPLSPWRAKGRILYVEDDPAVMAITQDMLARIGFEPCGVRDAQAALSALGSGQSFDIVLSDIVMPGGMNGIELAREIGRRAPGLPVLLTTGYSMRAEAAAQNGPDILVKPYDTEELAEALARCIASKRPGKPLASASCRP